MRFIREHIRDVGPERYLLSDYSQLLDKTHIKIYILNIRAKCGLIKAVTV